MQTLRSSVLLMLVTTLMLAGCSLRPAQLRHEEIVARVVADKELMFKGQEPMSKPLTLYDAAARALRYNLDYKLKIFEDALFLKVFEYSEYDMLPRLMASGGYDGRSNDSGGKSVSLETGTQSLEASTSQERNSFTTSAVFSWNLLDFGVSYIKAKQQSDQFLIAQERKRKVLQNVLQDVRSAYYRAVAAQKLLKHTEGLLVEAQQALEKSRSVGDRGLQPPLELLNYQRTLVDLTSILLQKKRELELSKIELAALINLEPGAQLELQETEIPALINTPLNLPSLEEYALTMRPELREEDFKKRITAAEAKKMVLSIMPGIEFDAGFTYDSDKFLYNSNWFSYGVKASLNLMRLVSLPAMLDMNEQQQKVDDIRRTALSMAVMTQIRIALQRYDMARDDFELMSQASSLDQKILQSYEAGARVGSENELELIRQKTRSLISNFQKYIAYSNAQAAWARLINSLGFDPMIPEQDTVDLASASKCLEETFTVWNTLVVRIGESRPAKPAAALTPVGAVK